MLLAIKDKTKGALGFFVIGLITIPFTLWGIQEYLGDDAPLYVAKVNDAEISTQYFNRVVSNQRQDLQQRFEGKLPFDEAFMKREILEQLINQRLVQDTSFKNGYRISDAMVFNKIKNNKNFISEGVFDKERYKTIINANGMSTAQYEQTLRSEMQATQMQNAILLSGFATKNEVRNYASLANQSREFTYIVFDKDNTPSDISVSEEDISDYYKANPSQFMSLEKVKVEYIEIKTEDLSSDSAIDEAQVNEMYEAYHAAVKQDEERKARHILLTAKESEDKAAVVAKLQDLNKQITDGASFEALAKAHSKDPGSAPQGGDLDWVSRGQMVKPFEKVLFELKEGEVSEIVETQFGFHLIKLDEIRSEKILSLAEKRDEFIAELKAELVDSEFYDSVENLAAVTYENIDTLEIPAEILNSKVQATELFTSQKGAGLAQHAKIREAAFSESVLENGENSDVIEITPEHVVVLRVVERLPAKVKPLEVVSDMIKETLNMRNSQEVVFAAVNSAKEKLDNGASLESLVTGKLKLNKTGLIKRQVSNKVDSRIIESGFKMVPPKDGKRSAKVVDLNSGAMALVLLDNVNTPSDLDEKAREVSEKNIMIEYSKSDFNSILSSIASNADIFRNEKVLQQ